MLSTWTAPILVAAALVLSVALYISVRWRRAPTAFRGMISVAGVCLLAGFLAGVWAFHFWTAKGLATSSTLPSSESSAAAPPGTVSAAEVGKAIVAMDEKHAGDSGWLSSAATVELCNKGFMAPDERLCRIAYLGRHATGQDKDRGPHEEWVMLTEVANFCDEGAIEKSSSLCERAYAARHARTR
jgi:hypothetical protein